MPCAPTGRPPRIWVTPTWRPTTTCWAPTPRCTATSAAPTTSTTPSTSPWSCSPTWPAFTDLSFATSILIGPQRQTALLAKQAAELDLLCDGRFRLGLGIGWNRVEYEALGLSFADRGRRLEEQIGVLRRLWTEESVTVEGRFHRITAAGLAPRPVQRPIPIWIGAFAPAALRRVGRLADGWFPMVRPGGGLSEALEIIADGAREAGRDPAAIQFEGRIEYAGRDLDRIANHADALGRRRGHAPLDQHHGGGLRHGRRSHRRPRRRGRGAALTTPTLRAPGWDTAVPVPALAL